MRIELNDERATKALGERLGALLRPGDCVALTGDLGAGKTTLTIGLGRGLGTLTGVTSPTFAIAMEHEGRVPWVHLDLYRIESEGELEQIGIDELLEGVVSVVEWADRFPEELPPDRLEVRLEDAARGRVAELRAHGSRSTALLRGLV